MQIPVFDALGNLTELRREDRVLIERYEYTPFGERSAYLESSLPCQPLPGSLAANQIGFHGLLEDPETGLLYARNRYYDPDMGRFVTSDPLGSVDGPNLYQFVGNDPVNGRDPLGLAGMQVSARGASRDLSGPELYRALLAEDFSFEAAESLVVASGLGAEIGADRVRAIAPGIAKAGPALRESLITAYVTGIGTPVVGLTATAAGFSWVGVSLVEGAASGVLLVGSSDLYHGQLSSADDYAMAALISASGGLVLRGGLRASLGRSLEHADEVLSRGLTGERGALNSALRSGPIDKSVGAMGRADGIARKLKLNINSPTTRQVLNSLDDKVGDFVGQFRQGSINRELPREVLDMTVEEALSYSTKVRKLLTDGRFVK